MRHEISNIEFEPVENDPKGLIGFVSFVFNHVQWEGLAVFSRIEGGARISWPERHRGIKRIKSARPISPKALEFVDQKIFEAIKEEIKNNGH